MDAFGTAHRAQASTHGVARFAHRWPVRVRLLEAELLALEQALSDPARPMVAIVGGSKVSTKLEVLETLSGKVDRLVVGGGIANTFLAASGSPVGKSLCEHDMLDTGHPRFREILGKTRINRIDYLLRPGYRLPRGQESPRPHHWCKSRQSTAQVSSSILHDSLPQIQV